MNRLLILLSNYIKYNFFYIESRLISFYSGIEESCYYSICPIPNSNVIIYGFGPYGEFVFIDLFKTHKILGIYDQKHDIYGAKVKSPDFINEHPFDYVIVTVMNDNARKSVTDFLLSKGIKQEKIIYVNLSK